MSRRAERDANAAFSVVVQIPCYNEEASLKGVLEAVPRAFTLASGERALVRVLVIDDGSEDRTADVARAGGAELLSLGAHVGLARAFAAGLDASLSMGARVIVNFDGDGQYLGADIARLVAPIAANEADLVIGARAVASSPHFSFAKRRFQVYGSALVRIFSGLSCSDATSGFRAFSREVALRLHVRSRFTYTLETLIQAGGAGMRMTEVPVEMQRVLRPSRLARSSAEYLWQSLLTTPRLALFYRPLRSCALLALLVATPALVLGLRYVILELRGQGGGHVQSLILCAILMSAAFVLTGLGLVGELIAAQRRVSEEVLVELRRRSFEAGDD